MISVYIYKKVSYVIKACVLPAVMFMSACGDRRDVIVRESGCARENPIAADSTALTIAVFPAVDALPLMLANDWGVLDSLGVKARFAVYRSQMDAEKSLADGKADAVLTDMFRVAWWQSRGDTMRFAFSTTRPLYIVPNKTLRVSRADQLDDRMIAVSRYSLDDYFADRVIATIKKRKGQILRPQINSTELRLSMLKAGQLDAVVLNTLQALKARSAGYASLQLGPLVKEGFAGFAFSLKSMRTKGNKLAKLRQAYDIAVSRLNRNAVMPQISAQTREALFISDGLDTLLDGKADFSPAATPGRALQAEASEWFHNAKQN